MLRFQFRCSGLRLLTTSLATKSLLFKASKWYPLLSAMALHLAHENVWLDKCKYDEAERVYYEGKAKELQTPLAAEVGRAREWLTNIKNIIEEPSSKNNEPLLNPNKAMEVHINKLEKIISTFERRLNDVVDRVQRLEQITSEYKPMHSVSLNNVPKLPKEQEQDDDDDVDLFGSESEDEDEAALQVRQKRLADYEAKKSKKPVLIAKSNIILDVKPWDDETDMKSMEKAVRAIETPGLLWGAAKLVPLAYGIHKLQISCVVEDDLVSIDWLQEQIEEVSDYVQSVDIAAFNKV